MTTTNSTTNTTISTDIPTFDIPESHNLTIEQAIAIIDRRSARRCVPIGLSRCLLSDETMVTTTERLEHWDDQLGTIQSVVGIGQMLCRVLVAYRKGNTKRLLQHLSIAAVTIYLLRKQPVWQERWEGKYQ